jgi:hypothetical protein
LLNAKICVKGSLSRSRHAPQERIPSDVNSSVGAGAMAFRDETKATFSGAVSPAGLMMLSLIAMATGSRPSQPTGRHGANTKFVRKKMEGKKIWRVENSRLSQLSVQENA